MKTYIISLSIIFIAATSARAQGVLYEFTGDAVDDSFGSSVSSAGDFDGDQTPDIIVGAYLDDNGGFQSGSARVYSGASGGEIVTFDGIEADAFGVSVSRAGDLNGDAFADVIVGAHGADNNGSRSGSAKVFSGQTHLVLFMFNGDAANDNLGISVSDAGDVNNDGVVDLIVGARQKPIVGTQGPGYARVYSGATGAILYTFTGAANGDYFGDSVSGAGDVNNDGRDDLIVGANQFVFGAGAGGTGYARVFSGLDGSLLYDLAGDAAGDRFGSAVAGVGDVNGDGHDDFAVGAPRSQSNVPGYVRVFSGATGAVLRELVGFGDEDRFGIALAAAGDLDGDGTGDLIVGAPTVIPPPSAAARPKNSVAPYVRTFSGATGAVIFTAQLFDEYGRAVDGAGDVNGDAVPDVIVGAPVPTFPQQSGPFVHVLSGPPAPPPGCAPVRTAASAVGAAAFAAVAGVLAILARRRKNLSRWERSARSAG